MMCVDGKGRTFISLSFLLLVSEMSHTLTAERKQVRKCGTIPTRSAEVAAPGTVQDSARGNGSLIVRYVPEGGQSGDTLQYVYSEVRRCTVNTMWRMQNYPGVTRVVLWRSPRS
ncbi:hypothetical protein GE21DRAFT_1199786 [Neurospora crassa]|nr:hypothetical protein 13E11.220 [imported] - Neurospora crassa [Neurospora crassa]KHE88251.1 hypothetical protein GE21DRAFT_1199786 [Neurospora crassa]